MILTRWHGLAPYSAGLRLEWERNKLSDAYCKRHPPVALSEPCGSNEQCTTVSVDNMFSQVTQKACTYP